MLESQFPHGLATGCARWARADCRCGQLRISASGSHVLGRGVCVVCPTSNSHCPGRVCAQIERSPYYIAGAALRAFAGAGAIIAPPQREHAALLRGDAAAGAKQPDHPVVAPVRQRRSDGRAAAPIRAAGCVRCTLLPPQQVDRRCCCWRWEPCFTTVSAAAASTEAPGITCGAGRPRRWCWWRGVCCCATVQHRAC